MFITEVFMHKTCCAVTHWTMTGMARKCRAKPKNHFEMKGHSKIFQNLNNRRTPIMNLPMVLIVAAELPQCLRNALFQRWQSWEAEYWEEAVASARRSSQTYGNCKDLCVHVQFPRKLPGISWSYPGIELDMVCVGYNLVTTTVSQLLLPVSIL